MTYDKDLGLSQEQYQFYQRCAEILQTSHDFSKKYSRPTRWNHRASGNGRFPGWGTIRWFNRYNIYLCFHTPVLVKRFREEQECIEWLMYHCKHSLVKQTAD